MTIPHCFPPTDQALKNDTPSPQHIAAHPPQSKQARASRRPASARDYTPRADVPPVIRPTVARHTVPLRSLAHHHLCIPEISSAACVPTMARNKTGATDKVIVSELLHARPQAGSSCRPDPNCESLCFGSIRPFALRETRSPFQTRTARPIGRAGRLDFAGLISTAGRGNRGSKKRLPPYRRRRRHAARRFNHSWPNRSYGKPTKIPVPIRRARGASGRILLQNIGLHTC